jgi:hypothetical protein
MGRMIEDDIRRFLVRGTGNQVPNNTSLYDDLTFKQQATINVNQAAAVQNTWYTLMSTTNNVRLMLVGISMDTAVETIVLELTADGQVFTGTRGAAVIGTIYYAIPNVTAGAIALIDDGGIPNYRAFMLEGRTISLRMRKTTNVGAGTLSGYVVYASR